MSRQQKMTLGEMRESGPTRLIVYCGDYRCAHSVAIDAGRWDGDVRLSDLEPKFTCKVCGHRGADTRANGYWLGRRACLRSTPLRRIRWEN